MSRSPELERSPEATREQSPPFIGREEILDAVIYALGEPQDNFPSSARPIIPVQGPPGSGKTTLVKELKERWSRSENVTVVTADCKEFPADGGKILAHALRNQFSCQDPSGDDERPSLIILDNIETVADRAELYRLFAEHPEAVIVCTSQNSPRVMIGDAPHPASRRAIKWQKSESSSGFPLDNFTPEEVAKQTNTSPQVAQVIYRHTFGHPKTTALLVESLITRGINPSNSSAEMVNAALVPEMVTPILRQAIDRFFQKMPEEYREAEWKRKLYGKLVRSIAVLRWVDTATLRAIAEKADIIEPHHGEEFYLGIMGSLQRASILTHKLSESASHYCAQQRSLVLHYLELTDQDRLQKAHRAALDHHREHLTKHPEFKSRYLPQVLYHAATLAKLGNPKTTKAKLHEWWAEFLEKERQYAQKYQSASPAEQNTTSSPAKRWQDLLDALENDPDKKDFATNPATKELFRRVMQTAESHSSETETDRINLVWLAIKRKLEDLTGIVVSRR